MKQLTMSVEEARAAGFLPKKSVSKSIVGNHNSLEVKKTAKLIIDEAQPTKRKQNKTEYRYDQYLKSCVLSEKIIRYEFCPFSIRLGDDLRYIPDFYILCLDGSVQFHDTKGRKKKTYYSRTVGKIKIKMAAEKYPEFKFFVVWPSDNGGWVWQRY